MGIRTAIRRAAGLGTIVAVSAVIAAPAAADTSVDPAQGSVTPSGSVTPDQGIGTAVKQNCGYAKKAKGKAHKKKQNCSRNARRKG